MDTVGKLYSNNCGYCKQMESDWDQMKQQVAGKVEVVDFEASDNFDEKLAKFNKERNTDVKLQGGYPTIFKIKGGQVSYHNGGRSAQELVNWATGTKGGKKKSKKNKSKKNKSRRQRK